MESVAELHARTGSTIRESPAAGHGSTPRERRQAAARAAWRRRRRKGWRSRRRPHPIPSRARLIEAYLRDRERTLGARDSWSDGRRRNIMRGAITFAAAIQQDAIKLRAAKAHVGTTGPQRARGLQRAGRARVSRTVRRHRALAQRLGILHYHHVRRRRYGGLDYVLIGPARRRDRGLSTCPTGTTSSNGTSCHAAAGLAAKPPRESHAGGANTARAPAAGARRPPPPGGAARRPCGGPAPTAARTAASTERGEAADTAQTKNAPSIDAEPRTSHPIDRDAELGDWLQRVRQKAAAREAARIANRPPPLDIPPRDAI